MKMLTNLTNFPMQGVSSGRTPFDLQLRPAAERDLRRFDFHHAVSVAPEERSVRTPEPLRTDELELLLRRHQLLFKEPLSSRSVARPGEFFCFLLSFALGH